MKPLPCLAAGIHVMNNQTGTFTDTQAGLIEKQDQEIITPPERCYAATIIIVGGHRSVELLARSAGVLQRAKIFLRSGASTKPVVIGVFLRPDRKERSKTNPISRVDHSGCITP